MTRKIDLEQQVRESCKLICEISVIADNPLSSAPSGTATTQTRSCALHCYIWVQFTASLVRQKSIIKGRQPLLIVDCLFDVLPFLAYNYRYNFAISPRGAHELFR
jgi:hypothetical protein